MAEVAATTTESPESIPSQSNPEVRDIEARQNAFRAYREHVRQESGEDAAQNIDVAEDEFLRQHFDASQPHEGKVVFDEHGRVQEINAVYLDQMLEKYVGKVAQVEQRKQEAKKYTGVFGRAKRWLNETHAGKLTKIGAKITLGGVAWAGAFGAGLFAPALHYAGGRAAIDGIGEAIQYGFERPILDRLELLNADRARIVVEGLTLRNEIANKNDDYDLVPIDHFQSNGELLQVQLKRLVDELERVEIEISDTEEHLANIRSNGRIARTTAGLAYSAWNIYDLVHNGLSMGVHDFDKGLPTTSRVVAGHIVNETTNGAVHAPLGPHGVKLFADGAHFIYNSGDHLAGSMMAHAGQIGNLGATAPWGEIGLATASFGVAMLGSTAYELNDIGNQRHIAESMANPTAQNTSVFSLRGRQTHGAESGSDHEVADALHAGGAGGVRREINTNRENIEQKKALFVKGSVWRIPASPTAAVAGVSPADRIIQVDHWDKTDLYYQEIDPTSDMTTNSNGIVVGSLRAERNADQILEPAVKEAMTYDEYKTKHSAGTSLEKLLDERGAKIEVEQTWRASSPVSMTVDDGVSLHIDVGDVIRIDNLSNDKTHGAITVTDNSGASKGTYNGANIYEIVKHGAAFDTKKEKERDLETQLKEINNELKTWGLSKEVGDAEFFRYNDGVNPDRWVFIGSVDKENGQITYFIGDGFAAINGMADTKAKKAAITNAMDTTDPEEQSFGEFQTFLSETDPATGSRKNKLYYEATIK